MRALIQISFLVGVMITQSWHTLSAQPDPVANSMQPVHQAASFSKAMEKEEAYFKENIGGYKPYKRVREFMFNRLGPNGELTNSTALNLKAYNEMLSAPGRSRLLSSSHNGNWTFTGPSATSYNDGIEGMGRVNRITFHPTDPNILFASSAGGGIWKTIDQGMNWFPLSDGIPDMNTTGLAINPLNTDILYALTGDGDSRDNFALKSIGVIKSTDGGATWDSTGLVFNASSLVNGYNLYMDPEDPSTLYVCTDIGLFRTENGGEDWDTLRTEKLYELAFKPGDSDRLYVVSDSMCYVSANKGTDWIDSTYIPPIVEKFGKMCVTTCQSNPEIVYIIASPVDTATVNDSIPDHRGLWLSVNSGADFNLVTTRPNLMAGSSGTEFKSQAWYDFAFECNPLDENEIFVGTIGMWKSTNGGVDWTSDNGINSRYHADVHDVKINPLDQMLYIATDGGIFMSTDLDTTYVFRSYHLAATQYYKMAVNPHDEFGVFAGAQDNGVHLRNDDQSFFFRVLWGDGMKALFHPTDPWMQVAATQDGEIFLSDNAGASFDRILPVPGGDTATWITIMALDANDTDVIYAGYKPVMKSTDHGETFQAISADTISAKRILETSLSNPDYIYVGDCRKCGKSDEYYEMYLSTTAGNDWDKVSDNPGFPDTSLVVDAAFNPDDEDEVWISCARFQDGLKVFRSVDGGATWTNESGSLPNVPINGIVFHDTDGTIPGAVYVATDIGIFYRDDELGDWIYFSNGLPRNVFTDIDIDYLGGRVRASSYGRGLWESPLYSSCIPTLSLNATNQLLGHSYVHHVTDKISSKALVDGYGSRVIYRSENRIVLNQGFFAKTNKGALFFAELGPCDASGEIFPLQEGGEQGAESREQSVKTEAIKEED